MNASTRASADELETLYSNLLRLLGTLDEAALNWRPGIDETNSIAVLVAHIVGACGRWLSTAAGDTRLGDRPAEFRTRATPGDVTSLVQHAQEDARAWYAEIGQLDPGTPRPTPGGDGQTTVAYCMLHALTHAHEHWGQILVTRQLAEAAVGTKS